MPSFVRLNFFHNQIIIIHFQLYSLMWALYFVCWSVLSIYILIAPLQYVIFHFWRHLIYLFKNVQKLDFHGVSLTATQAYEHFRNVSSWDPPLMMIPFGRWARCIAMRVSVTLKHTWHLFWFREMCTSASHDFVMFFTHFCFSMIFRRGFEAN